MTMHVPYWDAGAGAYCENLKNKNLNSAFQAMLDAMDIWLGCLRYVFDYLNPISGNFAARHMFQFLQTDIGGQIYLAGLAFFGFFGFSANYFDDKKPGSWGEFTDAYWPYLRDSFKALKWTFRGCRNILVIFEKMHWLDLTLLISPIGMFLGIIAAANRWTLRDLVEDRKRNKKFNKAILKHAKNIQAVYVELDEMPDASILQQFYEKTIIQYKGLFYYVLDGQLNGMQQDILAPLRFKKRIDLYDFYQQSQQLLADETNSQVLENYLASKKAHLSKGIDLMLSVPIYQQHGDKQALRSILNGIFNSPYYFLGVVLMIPLSQAYFFWGLVICSGFCLLNIASEYIQEREYQRELDITACKAKMSLLKRLVSMSSDLLRLNVVTADKARNQYIADYNTAKQELADLLVLDNTYLSMQGVRNGLLCYGIINGCLNTIATIAFLYHWEFMTVSVFSGSIILGLVLLGFGIAYTFYSAYFCQKVAVTEARQQQDYHQQDEAIREHFSKEAWDCMHDRNDIQATPNALISPQCEILRQGLTGEKKGLKLLQTSSAVFENLAPDHYPSSLYLYSMVGIFYVFEFCCKGIRAMVQAEDDAFKESSTWKVLTFFDRKNTALVQAANDDECVNSLLN